MASDPRIRASDADRERVAAALREHLAAGRLTLDEFNDRLDKTYAARTAGELDEVMSDLPGVDLQQLPEAPVRRAGGRPPGTRSPAGPPAWSGQGRFSPAWRRAWGSWLALSLATFAIWLLSGASGGPWFLWVVVPLGALTLGRWAVGGPGPGRRGRAGPGRDHRHHHRDEDSF